MAKPFLKIKQFSIVNTISYGPYVELSFVLKYIVEICGWYFLNFELIQGRKNVVFFISHGIVAMAVESEGSNLLLIGCDLGGVKPDWSSDLIQHRLAPTLLRFSFLSPRIKLKRESVKIKNQQNFSTKKINKYF